MKEDRDILGKLIKSKKPEVPEGFFTQFPDSLLSKIKEDSDEKTVIDSFGKSKKPIVPEGFFENFPNEISEIIKGESSSNSKIIKISVWTTVISVAAVLTILFWINRSEDSIEIADVDSVETDFQEEDYDAYLAFLDEDEIIDYILNEESDADEDMSSEDFDEIYEYLSDDIEELYLDL